MDIGQCRVLSLGLGLYFSNMHIMYFSVQCLEEENKTNIFNSKLEVPYLSLCRHSQLYILKYDIKKTDSYL